MARAFTAATFLALLGVFLLFDPTFSDPYREGKIRLLLLAATPLGAYFLWRTLDPVVGLLWAWGFALWLLYGFDSYSVTELATPLAAGALFLAVDSAQDGWRWAMRALRVAFAVQVALGLLEASGVAIFYAAREEHFQNAVLGTMGHPTLVGAFVAALIPTAFMRWSKWEAAAGLILVVLASSTMSYAALGAGIAGALWKASSPRHALALVSLAAIVLAALYALRPGDEFFSVTGRWVAWEPGLRAIAERPVMGWGPGAWLGLYPHWGIRGAMEWRSLHSDWLQLALELGIPAAVAAGVGYVTRIWRSTCAVQTSILAAIGVNALGNFPFHFVPTAILFCFALAFPSRRPLV